MPPRRGGRGRGKMRARPPQVIRNTMTELGMGSITTFELLAKAAAAQNADAARAFFPILGPERKVKPEPLNESEKIVTQLLKNLKKSINNSPHAIQRRCPKKVRGLGAELSAVKNYFCSTSEKEGTDAESENLWDLDKCWVIPEAIPSELVPPHVRRDRNQRKRRRVNEEEEDNDVNHEDSVLPLVAHANRTQPEEQNAVQGDDDEDADGQAGEAERGEDDDDLELDADYQTGVRFDDDDGYDDPDSGAEEATF